MAIPEWLKNYKPTEADRASHALLILSLMEDHDQTIRFATRELSDLYLRLCERRSGIEESDPETYGWIHDHESGIIDRVVGACLVVVQGEVARITELYRNAYGKNCKDLPDRLVRDACSPKIQTYSVVEAIYQLANFFKHDDELSAAIVNSTLDRRQSHTLAVVAECGTLEAPLIYHPGHLERAVGTSIGCSPEQGLLPVSERVDAWRSGLMAKIRMELVGDA